MRCKDERENRCQKEVIEGCDGCILLEYTEKEIEEMFDTQIYISKYIKNLYQF